MEEKKKEIIEHFSAISIPVQNITGKVEKSIIEEQVFSAVEGR